MLLLHSTCKAAEVGLEGTEGVRVFEKLKFSMLTDEVREVLKRDHADRKDVLLLGVEVQDEINLMPISVQKLIRP